MSEAVPADVREVIDTDLSDLDISDIIDRAARDIDREYDADAFDDTQHRRDFAAVLTALRIASVRDRRGQRVSSESSSIEFEVSERRSLRARAARLDPFTAFSTTAIRTDSNRGYGSSGYGGES